MKDEKDALAGEARVLPVLKAASTNSVSIPLTVPFAKLQIDLPTNGMIRYAVRGEAVIRHFEDSPVAFSYRSEIPVPKLPSFDIQEIQFTGFSPLKMKTSVAITVGIYNSNYFELRLRDINFNMEMSHKPVLTETQGEPIAIQPQGMAHVHLSFSLDLTPLKEVMLAFLSLKEIPIRFSGSFELQRADGAGKTFNFDTKKAVLIGK